MDDGNHKHDKKNPYGIHKHRKIFIVAIFGLLFAIVAFSIAQSALDQQTAFEIIVNNTNLAPTIHAEHPGTGERVNATTYYANSSAIELHVFAHAVDVNDVAGTFVSINGTVVCARSGRPLGAAESAYRGCDLIIPRYSYYWVNFSNYHHYEWREYPILSGRNGTLSINQTVINQGGAGGGVSFDGNPVNLNGSSLYNGSNQQGTFNHSNLTSLNWSVANHTIDTDVVFYPYNISIGDGSKFNSDPYFGLITKSTSYSNITMYVRPTGSDANNNNCVSSATPCLTIQHAINNIPATVNAYITIDINGTFNEAVDFRGKYVSGSYRIKLKGNSTDEDFNGTISSCRQGATTSPSNITVSGAGWATNQYRMSFVKFYSGNNIGVIRPIHSNNATQLNVTGKLPITCSAGDGISIYTIPEKISPLDSSYSLTMYGIRSIDIENINLTKGLSATGADFVEYNIYSSSKNHFAELASTFRTYDSVYDVRCSGAFSCMLYSGFSRGEFYRDLIIGNGTAGNYMYLQSSSSNVLGEGTIIDGTQIGVRTEINSGVQMYQGTLGIYPRIINQVTAGVWVRNIGSVVVDTTQAYFANNPIDLWFTYNQDAGAVYFGSSTDTLSLNGTHVIMPSYVGVGNRPLCVRANGTVYPSTINSGTGLCN